MSKRKINIVTPIMPCYTVKIESHRPPSLHCCHPLSSPIQTARRKGTLVHAQACITKIFLTSPLLQTDTHQTSLAMAPKPAKTPSGDTQAVKKHRQGFRVGPDNLPDGPWRRKGTSWQAFFLFSRAVADEQAKHLTSTCI